MLFQTHHRGIGSIDPLEGWENVTSGRIAYAHGVPLRSDVCHNRRVFNMTKGSSGVASRPGLSLDWISFLVALGLVALARAGVLGAVPW